MSIDFEPTVTLKFGLKISGTQETTLRGSHFAAFKGIPYAESPTGNLRFKPPVRKVWKSKHYNAIKEIESMQYDEITNGLIGDEDCLVLNVFTQNTRARNPVIAFIHGGGFTVGSGIKYGPRKLLDQNVVLVSINYRLHVFGFLCTGDAASPGNYGLLDQIEALKWIQNNIEEFGGDPNNVTIMGQSAGAGSAMHLMISPLAKDLFHRAIFMSGNSFCTWAMKPNPKDWAIKLARAAECLSSDSYEIVDYLRKIPAEKLTAILMTLCKEVMVPMNPVVDGYVLPDDPQMLFDKGLVVNKVPVLMGVTKDEGLAFLPVLQKYSGNISNLESLSWAIALTLVIEKRFVITEVIELVINEYFESVDVEDKNEIQKAFVKIVSDGAFVAGHYHAINMLQNAGIQPYLYSCDYESEINIENLHNFTDIRGVSHADDMHFLFDCRKNYLFHSDSEILNNKIEETFLNIWINFARNGTPSHDNLNGEVMWMPSIPGDIKVYHLNETITVQYPEDGNRKIDFWLKQLPKAIVNQGKLIQLTL